MDFIFTTLTNSTNGSADRELPVRSGPAGMECDLRTIDAVSITTPWSFIIQTQIRTRQDAMRRSAPAVYGSRALAR